MGVFSYQLKMNLDDSDQLFDSHGNLIRKKPSDREALEALIRSELAEAKEKLRESNKKDLVAIADKYYKPKLRFWHKSNAYTFAALVASILIGFFTLPELIKTTTANYIKEHLVGTALTNTVGNVIKDKADVLIEARLKPIHTNIAFLETNINNLTLDFSHRQAQLVSDQMAIREQLHQSSGQIHLLESSIDTAQEQSRILQDEQKLMALLNRGEVFDKDAIQELQTIANGTNATAPLAQAMFNKIRRNLIIDRYASSWITFVQKMGDKEYGGPFTSDELAVLLSNQASPQLDGLVNILSNNKLFVPTLYQLAHQSKDLWTISRIAKKLKEIADVDFVPWDLQPLDQWWATNSLHYTNWPLSQFNKAMEAVHACRYGEALKNFEFVLTMDPAADESRAFAIACAIETGNMPKAQQLNTNYAIQDGRWSQWAQGKMMLTTNAIRQGTEKYVWLTKTYPTFVLDAFIFQGNDILQKMDWKLYSTLMQSNNSAASLKTK